MRRSWAAIQLTAGRGYAWGPTDEAVALAAEEHLEMLPFLISTPPWLAHDWRSLAVANRGRLNLRQVNWFTWKDAPGACSFCDSSGLFPPRQAFPAEARLARLRPHRP